MRFSNTIAAVAIAAVVAGCQSGCAGINEAIFGPPAMICQGGANAGKTCVLPADCPESACISDTPASPQEQANQGIATAMELIAATNEQLVSLLELNMIKLDLAESLVNKLDAANNSLRAARSAVASNDLNSWRSAVTAATSVAREVLFEIAKERAAQKARGG